MGDYAASGGYYLIMGCDTINMNDYHYQVPSEFLVYCLMSNFLGIKIWYHQRGS